MPDGDVSVLLCECPVSTVSPQTWASSGTAGYRLLQEDFKALSGSIWPAFLGEFFVSEPQFLLMCKMGSLSTSSLHPG